MEKIIGLVLILVMTFSLASCGETMENEASQQEGQEESVVEKQEPKDDEITDEVSCVDAFIQQYNEKATVPITDIVEVDITDKESGHYRTEFRLGAFSDSEAKTGKIGNTTIDIVCYGKKNEKIRIYADEIELKQVKDIVKYASPILDNELNDSDISDTLEYIDTNKEANSYYYGDIGMTLLGNSLMLKVE